MKQKLTIAFIIFCLNYSASAQKFLSPVKQSLLGFHFALVDYNSPTAN